MLRVSNPKPGAEASWSAYQHNHAVFISLLKTCLSAMSFFCQLCPKLEEEGEEGSEQMKSNPTTPQHTTHTTPPLHHYTTTPPLHHCTTTPPQHHHNSTTTPPQHHHNSTTTAPQHHHNSTTTPPQQHHNMNMLLLFEEEKVQLTQGFLYN
jgi:hypothetical protein